MQANEVKKVMVVGAGIMGHGIAQTCAQAGLQTNLVDVNPKILEHALNLIRVSLDTLVEHGHVPAGEVEPIMSRIHGFTEPAAAAEGVDFVIEAVSEVPEIKQKVFSQLDRLCPQDTVLATNTSSLDVFSLVKVRNPSRLVAAHWFLPAQIVPLVEVCPGPQTSPEVLDLTDKLMQRLGKKTVLMKAFVPGFIVNRIQQGIAASVFEMLAQGWATPEDIDKAVKLSLGVRLPVVGVVQTMDFTGLDLIYDIQKASGRIVPIIEEKFKQGHLGAKTSKGIYDYGGRSEAEILKKRDLLYLKMLDHLDKIKAFQPI